MSRDATTHFALVDAAFIADTKFRKLARLLPDLDDFNSAVGAYFVALAASRRNRSPRLDIAAETGSRFVSELREAGLVLEAGFPPEAWAAWTPKAPQQRDAGLGRAQQAATEPGGGRDKRGQFVSVSSALDETPTALDESGRARTSQDVPVTRDDHAGMSSALDQRVTSHPIPSHQLPSERSTSPARARARQAPSSSDGPAGDRCATCHEPFGPMEPRAVLRSGLAIHTDPTSGCPAAQS